MLGEAKQVKLGKRSSDSYFTNKSPLPNNRSLRRDELTNQKVGCSCLVGPAQSRVDPTGKP